jgi:hypothetical protein
MKKKMRLTALLAGAMITCNAIPTTANAFDWYWGTAANNAYSDMTVLDDRGMLKGFAMNGTEYRDYQVVTQHESRDIEVNASYADDDVIYVVTGTTDTITQHIERDLLWVIMPRKHTLRVVLRSDLDEAAAKQKAEAIIKKYEADLQNGENPVYSYFDRVFEIYYGGTDAPSEELAGAIMHDLAEAGFISEFYTWGQTADYKYIEPDVLTFDAYRLDESDYKTMIPNFNLTAVNEYFAANGLACAAEEIIDENGRMLVNGTVEPFKYYRIDVDEGMTLAEQFAVSAGLYANFGYMPRLSSPETVNSDIAKGQNALTVKGDLNLDCRTTVADAVMLARLTAEDQTVNITDAGLANADVDSDGNMTALDVTALLREIAGIK